MLNRHASSFAHVFRRRADGLDNVLVAGAAAQVGREHVKQVVVADIGLALEHADSEHQEAGRAEAALQAVVVHKGLLHRMQLIAIGQAFDGPDLFTVRLHGEHQAGAYWLTVDDYCAGAANTVFAANMGPGLPAVLADCVRQGAPRLDGNRMIAAVDGQDDVRLRTHLKTLASHPLVPAKAGTQSNIFQPL